MNALRPCSPVSRGGLALLAVLAALASSAAARAQEGPADSLAYAVPDSTFVSAADSLWGVTAPVLVIGTTTSRTADPGHVSLDAVTINARDARAAADLGPPLPATKVNVNSRGESTFMVRGASERHVALLLDGIPLNVPWDERVDLSLVPADAVGSVTATRGVASVLDGPNALAGTIELSPPSIPGEGRRTRLGAQIGESHFKEGRLLHQQRAGAWSWLAAVARREQSGFLVPDDFAAPHNQGPGRERLNSDLAQTSLLLRAERALGADGSLRVTLAGADGGKGVPPETHLDDGARYWRFPEAKRALLGAALALPLDAARRWDLQASAAADLAHQEIRAYDDSTYTIPALVPGVEYETDDDRTGHARARVTRRLGETTAISVQGVARYTNHRESLVLDGEKLAYAQWLGSLVAEGHGGLGAGWRVRGGGGYEFAATPETGDKPSRDATGGAVAHVRLERTLGERLTAHATASRRSRFPSLRELYSGALGRFVPNPDLAPERQDLFETGAVARAGAWEAGVTGFITRLHGGIEKVALPDRQFQRVNVDEIRTLGAEAILAWRPASAWAIAGHATLLSARREVEGAWTGPVEDRPAYVAWVTASWSAPWGAQLAAEGSLVGARESADVTDEIDGLRRLPAQASWSGRAAWTWRDAPGPLTRAELYVRVNNVLDRLVEAQVGLPEAGRMVSVGVNAWFDAWGAR